MCRVPGGAALPAGTDSPDLRLISWNITLKCPLRCAHCYVNAGEREAAGVLSTEEAYAVIDQICELGRPVVILSGGEPLMRDDIFKIARYGTQKGLVMAMGTSGVLIDETCAREIRDSGIRKVAISIDSADPAVHDSFRGLARRMGAGRAGDPPLRERGDRSPDQHDRPVSGYKGNKRRGLAWHRPWRFGLPALFPVPTGRGTGTPWLTPQVYEDLIREVLANWRDTGVNIRPTCAPQFRRIADTLGIHNPAWGRGCIAGTRYCRIFADGDVTPCPYLPARAGNVRESPLETIWHESPVFSALRDVSHLTGKCGRCGYREVCGGCRARSYAASGTMTDRCGGIAWPADPAGNLCGEDPWCRVRAGRKGHSPCRSRRREGSRPARRTPGRHPPRVAAL